MKKIYNILMAAAISLGTFTSCEDVPMPFNNPLNYLEPDPEVIVIDPVGNGTKDSPYNVQAVLNYLATLEADVKSDKDVYVTGVVTSVKEAFGTQYGNATFNISDNDEGSNSFTCYQVMYFNNAKYTAENEKAGDLNVNEGDVVVICGKVINFRGSTPETQGREAYVVSINGKTVEPKTAPKADAKGSGTEKDPYNVSGVLKYLESLGADKQSSSEVYIKGKVKAITEQFGTQYGNATFTMIDEGFNDAIFTAYRILYLGNKKYTDGDVLKEGDEVIVCGKVVLYKGNTPETVQGSGYLFSLNGKTGSNGGDTPTPPAPTSGGTLDNPFTPEQANAFIATLPADQNTETDYYIKGKIIEVTDKNQFNTQYGNASFYISDDGTDKDAKFYVFRTYYLGNQKYTDDSWTKPKAGDEVIICGKLVNYKGNTPETVANKNYIYSLNGKTSVDNGGGETTTAGTTADNPFTPKQANEFIATLAADKNTETDYYIKGKIIEITDKNQFSTQYGNCSFYISDDGTDKEDKFYVFRTYYLGNVKYSDDSWTKPKAGDEVIICGKLVNYKGNTPETVANKNYIYSLNGKTAARRK